MGKILKLVLVILLAVFVAGTIGCRKKGKPPTGVLPGEGEEIEIPEVKAGDFVAILTAGAYASVMSSSYNARPKAPEVLVKENKFYIIREKQTYEKMIEGEKIPDFLK